MRPETECKKRSAHCRKQCAHVNRTCVSGLRSKYRWGGNYSLATARRSVPHPASEDRIDDGRGSHPVRFWSVVVGSLLH